MKKMAFCLLTAFACIFYACENTTTDIVTYKINEPVLMSLNDFRNSVQVIPLPREITQQGKMCFFEGYLYISEPEKGIHILDNRNPSSPQNIGFIELLGNVDLAIRDNNLYADSYIDLVWFDISNPAQPQLKGRLESVFPQGLPEICNEYGIDYNKVYTQNGIDGIVTGWRLVERKEDVKDYRNDMIYAEFYTNPSLASDKSSTGATGSMARFGIYGDYMYSVIDNQLSIFDISGGKPEKAAEGIWVGYNVETIFNYEDKLFMGTPTGLLIYSVENPLAPRHRAFIGHIWGCDPVVVENNVAFVTVRSGNTCGQNVNELIVIDVSNVDSPRPIVTYNMKNPKGLGIDNGTLFLCDDGLKVYDASDPLTMMGKRLAYYSGMDAYDVIPFNNVLMMIAEDGIYQYDYSNLNQIRELSKISINKKT